MVAPFPYSWRSTAQSLANSLAVNMPNDPLPEPGMLLTAFVSGDTIGSDAMSGWDKIGATTNGTQMINVYRCVAVGGGNDSGTATGAGFKIRLAWCVATANWDGVLANVLLGAASANSLNPTSVSMGATRDHLAYAIARNNNNAITGAPSGYSNFNVINGSGGPTWLAWASKAFTASSEDPGAFSGTTSAASSGVVGIRPGGVGAPPWGRFMPFF